MRPIAQGYNDFPSMMSEAVWAVDRQRRPRLSGTKLNEESGSAIRKRLLILIWGGWFFSIFFVALGFAGGDLQLSNLSVSLVIIMLGQSAIITGVGLAVVSGLSEARNSLLERPRSQRLAVPPRLPPIEPPPLPRPSETVVATGQLAGRAYTLFGDGCVLVETRLGRRRFRNLADAKEFVGDK
jgi:hypothetical protein